MDKMLEQKIITCLDGKKRIFSIYDNHIYYSSYKNGKPFGRIFSIRTEDIVGKKYPRFITAEMLFETEEVEPAVLEIAPKAKGRIIGYMRISTDNHSQKFDRQQAQLIEAGCTYIYQDRISGAKREREELNRMLQELQAGDTIVITEIARLSRSTLDLLEIVKLLKDKGILLKSLHDTWLDISEDNPLSNFMLTMLGGLAEMERAMITERVRQGVAIAKKKGVKFGRPTAKKDTVNHALELYHAGEHTVKEICTIAHISKATLYRKLKEEKA